MVWFPSKHTEYDSDANNNPWKVVTYPPYQVPEKEQKEVDMQTIYEYLRQVKGRAEQEKQSQQSQISTNTLLKRLIEILGLPEVLRDLITAAAQKPLDIDIWEVLADALEERAIQAHKELRKKAAKMRKKLAK